MSFPFGKRPSGFTLIELLIVVAIIAILAAIAVPNFLEAQTRSKVSRAKADMRSMATALEAYRVDNNAYPNCHNFGYVFDGTPTPTLSPVLERLSTPIAYITTSLMPDPFVATARTGTINSSTGTFTPSPIVQGTTDGDGARYLKYYTPGETGLQDVDTPGDRARFCFLLSSTGPWLTHPNMGGLFAAGATDLACLSFIYDPTNGTVSRGSIFRTGGTNPPGNYGATFFRWAQSTQK